MPESKQEPLAIVGIGCRFPGRANSPDSFWDLLIEGKSGIREVPDDRWNVDRYYHPDSSIPIKMITKWGGFVEDVDKFDASFFGISPREAQRMDPQQRWLLELTWEAFEDAGEKPINWRGSATGVYVGISSNEYGSIQMMGESDIDVHTNSGSTLSIASNRISYLYDLKGPSISVDTACSSALVAVNLACKSIWSGECDAAFAGGVNALLMPDSSIGFSKASMLSPTGQCFAFDARANGYVRGEGAGMILIKPLARAHRDGDRIYATIRATVVNQDGNTSSMTVPGKESQAAMLRQAYQQAGIDPSRVGYMEAHGTGTPVGDPIETRALGEVLCEGRSESEQCIIGSVKSNIGHLESGSGIAGLIKAALVLHNRQIPKNLNYETPNPNIPFKELKLEVPRENMSIPSKGDFPPVSAVNSFGFGGTNAHVVLEAVKNEDRLRSDESYENLLNRPFLLPISGNSESGLECVAKSYCEFLKQDTQHISEICSSVGLNRQNLDERMVVIGDDYKAMRSTLKSWIFNHIESSECIIGKRSVTNSDPVFVFTGQGSQWWGMGQELFQNEPIFRATIEKIDSILEPLTGWSLVEEMNSNEGTSRIDRTDIAQPAIFALQVALAELWKTWGVLPKKVVGHSVGEVAAAYVAGMYSLEDAIKIIYHRSYLQNKTGGKGRMAVVGLSKFEAEQIIKGQEDKVQVAVVNGPAMVTLAGDTQALEGTIQKIEKEGIFVRWLRIDYAFHTHQMDPIKNDLLDALEPISAKNSKIPFYSTVTGELLESDDLNHYYWWRNVREPVLFSSAIQSLSNDGSELFLELGPHPALAGPIADSVGVLERDCSVLCSLNRKESEIQTILGNLARLHIEGVQVDWVSINQSGGKVVSVPKHAWNHERFWIECDQSFRHRLQAIDHPLLGLRQRFPEPCWEFRLDPREHDYLQDHCFWDSIIFPAAGYAEMGLAVARNLFPDEPYAVEAIKTEKALFISDKNVPTIRVVYNESQKSFSVYSSTDESKTWELNAQGLIQRANPEPDPINESIDCIQSRMEKHSTHEDYYKEYDKAGYQFGPRFRQLLNVWSKPNESVAEIQIPQSIVNTLANYHFHPAVLDACFHALKGAQVIPEGSRTSQNFYLPSSIRRVHLYRDALPNKLWAHAVITFDNGESVIADIIVMSGDGQRVADVLGFCVERIDQKDEEIEAINNSFYEFHWEPKRLKGSRVGGKIAFTNFDQIIEEVNAGKDERYERYDLANYYKDFVQEVDSLACLCFENSLKQLGWNPDSGSIYTTSKIIEKLGISLEHERLVTAQLKALSVAGPLEELAQGEWKVIREIGGIDMVQELDHLRIKYPNREADLDLYKLVWPRLTEVLSGETDALEILFPKGSSEVLESFYINGADFPANNEMISEAVQKAIEGVPDERAVRILEVGAGTGSLTRSVLEKLSPNKIDYTFSDTGQAFIADAKKEFAKNSSVNFCIFDIEKSPSDQGVVPESYDLVLATNVIHATSDLRNTLEQLKCCLADDGLLIFLEVTRSRSALDLVFGLLKGWWQYTDIDLRPNSALLNRQEWEDLISSCGYEDVVSFVNTPDPEESGQTAFMTRRGPSAFIEEIHSNKADDNLEGPDDIKKKSTAIIFSEDDDFFEELSECCNGEFDQVVRLSLNQDIGTVITNTPQVDVIIHAFGTELGLSDENLSEYDLIDAQRSGSVHLLKLIKTLSSTDFKLSPKVLILTRGSVHVKEGDLIAGIAMSSVVGLIRVARGEHPDFHWKHIDLDERNCGFEGYDISEEFLLSDQENEIAYRDGVRYVNRLRSIKAENQSDRLTEAVLSDESIIPFRLEVSSPGVLTNLSLNETIRYSPDPDQVEVLIKAGGINFRDVMKALGMYPGNPIDLRWFGDDFSGIVVSVGAKVKDFAVGDEVVGMAPYSFRSFVTVSEKMIFKKASSMTFEEAATLPTVFLTAHYGLNELARMKKGESVLIHAGTGGVGMAAIQIARRLGLEIFATAGTPEKRDLLLKLGAHYAMDSRSLSFADEIIKVTGGLGVDCVLNSLAGDFIPKSFSVLKPFGRFIEIGKVDVYNDSKIGLQQLRNNISYFVVDLAQHLQDKPDYVAEMFTSLAKSFDSGEYSPLEHTVFPITEAAQAFRYMAQGKHIGKNVLSFDCDSIPIAPCTQEGHLFKSNVTYLITGGMSGFGFELAKWMTQNGASHLVLVSRSGARDESILEDIEYLRLKGKEIVDLRADVTSLQDVERIMVQIDSDLPPLKGIIHGAMVIDDQFISDMDEESFNKVLYPKMLGAWNLHQATQNINLDHFIKFSSFSTVIGAVKQANYNAGNAFLDALSHYRQARGLPSLTINWGALIEAGFVERNQKTAAYLNKLGMKPYKMLDAQHVMSLFLPKANAQVAASVVDWAQLVKLSPALSTAPLYSKVVHKFSERGSGGSVRPQVIAAQGNERLQILEDFIADQVASVFGTNVAKIDRDTALTNIGLDSLMAIELMNRMESELGINLPMGTVLNGPNIKELAASILEQILAGEENLSEKSSTGNLSSSDIAVFERTGEELVEFPLSEGQKSLWFLYQLSPESAAYNLVFSSKLTPLVDIGSMEAAFRTLFERHPMLSATFHQVNGEPIQRMEHGKTIDFREHDASRMNEEQIKELIGRHAELPFDLEKGPVIRLELFRNNQGSHIVLLAMHHIISDAWSVSLLMNDLIESYFSIKSGKVPDLDPIEYSYQDYVKWQQHNLSGPYKKRASEYWLSSLEGASGSLDLPIDHPRPAVQTFNGGRLSFILDDNLASRVLELAQSQSVTIYTTMLSAYNALFHRYCDQDDIVVGSPVAGRNQKELGDMLGYFVNMVPLRSRTHDDPSFIKFLDRTSGSVNGAIEHQDYPFSHIINDLKMSRDPARSPLFQISFAMERVPGIDEQGIAVFLIGKGGHQFSVGDMTVETIDLNLRQAQFEITLVVEESGGQIFGCWQYNRDLFDSETIQKLSKTFSLVLENVTRNPDIKISEIELLSEDESELIISSWNSTEADYPKDKGIHHLVEEQASKTPDAVAVRFGEQKITYEELERSANNVAETLIAQGIGTGDSVALMVERNSLMIITMLGVLKSGAHYLPIDPDYPSHRIQQMLKDSGSQLLFVSEDTHHLSPPDFANVLRVEECPEIIELPDLPLFNADNLAYVIYTSGSTGEPKGVEISHSAAVNFLTSMRQTPGITRLDRLLALTTLSFDISILEIFLPLITGAQVVIATKEDARDGRRISRLLNEHSVTIMQATPTTWRILMESGWEGRNGLKILCGGEAMPRDLADFLVNSADEVWNLYGPTETTVWSTCTKILSGEEKLSIGKPIYNTKIYILDDKNNIQPISFVGEICIGGAGLARGYRRKEELTNERFIEVDISDQGPQRLYRTGDLGRWRPDGTLECLGRIDFQTKLRGFRIELGEIEFTIMNHEAVSSAVVIKRDDLPGGEALVAYFVIESELSDELLASIKEHLRDRLPNVMVPAYFVNLKALPLTPNQKIDRKALPAPESGIIGLDHKYIPPKTITETKLTEIFSDAFENPMISIKDNFFDMGGDSLMAVKIVSRVSNALEKDIPLEAFFRFPSIEKFAHFVDSSASMENVSESLPSGEEVDAEYLSFQFIDHDKLESLPNIDAVAISYIPESFSEVTGLSKAELINNWFGNKARLTNSYRTQWGTIGLIMLPVFEIDLYNDSNPISSIIMDGLRLSAKLGARKASLTGVLPLVTKDGLDVINWMRENDEEVNLPIITTGNATRCATIIKSIEGILARSGRDISELRVSFIGLGSIGKGTLDLMLDVLPHPRGIIMSDIYRQKGRLEELQDRLLASGFVGEIDIFSSRGELPDEIYESELIIAASNVPNIIDIEKVRSGTMIVDYSFPGSFSLIDAARRTEQEGDLIFTSGGQLRLGQEIEEIIYLPRAAEEMLEIINPEKMQSIIMRDSREMTGCILASIFTEMDSGVGVTLGEFTGTEALSHYAFINDLGLGSARLQMQSYFITDEAIQRFRGQSSSESTNIKG